MPNPTPLNPNDALADLEAAFEAAGEPADLLVIEQSPPPIGRSWAFDFSSGRFISGGSGPLPTNGEVTLIMWCEKAMRTARGAHPIHPPGYGLLKPTELIGAAVQGAAVPELEARIRDTLTFHPRISDITDFEWSSDPNEEWISIDFTIVRDDDSEIPVQTVLTLNASTPTATN